MNNKLILPLLAIAITVQAQDTYTNERITNNSGDVIGTARYVGMGGALGALGADISVISWNPAGIGFYRKNDIAMTFGGLWGKSHLAEENRGTGTFDQIGFVYNIKLDNETCPYINFAFNFQKKINYNQNFLAIGDLHELSQMDQLAELTAWDEKWQPNLAGLALVDGFFGTSTNAAGDTYRYNKYGASSSGFYKYHAEGSLQAFDFNLSTNINNRAFLGLTVGVDNMRYRGWNLYGEDDMTNRPKYDVYNDTHISGTGVNVKLGTILRPFESSPFRVGFVVETPTWYRLKNSTLLDIRRGEFYGNTPSEQWESYLPFNLRTPWKFRGSIGSTVGSSFAWDVDYEYAAYTGASIGYPNVEYDDGTTSGNKKDVAMNQLTSDNMRGIHTLRAGIEVNATPNLAFRLGYNLSTSPYKKNISYDQYYLNSKAMNYATGTNYMRMGTTNILTVGVGYRAKNFYFDLAYKVRSQKADFYAFDTSFANSNQTPIPQFVLDNERLADRTIDPVNVDLTRHAITCTLGFKFR